MLHSKLIRSIEIPISLCAFIILTFLATNAHAQIGGSLNSDSQCVQFWLESCCNPGARDPGCVDRSYNDQELKKKIIQCAQEPINSWCRNSPDWWFWEYYAADEISTSSHRNSTETTETLFKTDNTPDETTYTCYDTTKEENLGGEAKYPITSVSFTENLINDAQSILENIDDDTNCYSYFKISSGPAVLFIKLNEQISHCKNQTPAQHILPVGSGSSSAASFIQSQWIGVQGCVVTSRGGLKNTYCSDFSVKSFDLRRNNIASFGLLAFGGFKKVDNESLNDYKVPLCSEDPAEEECNDCSCLRPSDKSESFLSPESENRTEFISPQINTYEGPAETNVIKRDARLCFHAEFYNWNGKEKLPLPTKIDSYGRKYKAPVYDMPGESFLIVPDWSCSGTLPVNHKEFRFGFTNYRNQNQYEGSETHISFPLPWQDKGQGVGHACLQYGKGLKIYYPDYSSNFEARLYCFPIVDGQLVNSSSGENQVYKLIDEPIRSQNELRFSLNESHKTIRVKYHCTKYGDPIEVGGIKFPQNVPSKSKEY